MLDVSVQPHVTVNLPAACPRECAENYQDRVHMQEAIHTLYSHKGQLMTRNGICLQLWTWNEDVCRGQDE